MEEHQRNDPELLDIIQIPSSTSLNIKQYTFSESNAQVYCDISQNKIRPFVPTNLRRHIFDKFHGLSHPGIRATKKLITSRFVWPFMNRDIHEWARGCISCQKSKISKHTTTPFQSFQIPNSRFDFINMDIIGPLPPSKGFSYCLTCIDRFTCWAEAFPMSDMTADTVATTFYSQWVCRYGVPSRIVTDQRRQFESSLFKALASLLGCHRVRTSPYHPSCNGKIERWHRTLKSAIMTHNNPRWTEVLPTVLYIRTETILESAPLKCCMAQPYGCPANFSKHSHILTLTLHLLFLFYVRKYNCYALFR